MRNNKSGITHRIDRSPQCESFLNSLYDNGWHAMRAWDVEGFTFNLLVRRSARLIFQVYPNGEGFEVWRPVTESNAIVDTAAGVDAYVEEVQRLEQTKGTKL